MIKINMSKFWLFCVMVVQMLLNCNLYGETYLVAFYPDSNSSKIAAVAYFEIGRNIKMKRSSSGSVFLIDPLVKLDGEFKTVIEKLSNLSLVNTQSSGKVVDSLFEINENASFLVKTLSILKSSKTVFTYDEGFLEIQRPNAAYTKEKMDALDAIFTPAGEAFYPLATPKSLNAKIREKFSGKVSSVQQLGYTNIFIINADGDFGSFLQSYFEVM